MIVARSDQRIHVQGYSYIPLCWHKIKYKFDFCNCRERSLDGTCNNPHQPTMGASFTPYIRMFSSYFTDGQLCDALANDK